MGALKSLRITAPIYVECPACGDIMAIKDKPAMAKIRDRWISCGRSGCELNGKRYELPTVEVNIIDPESY
jgi:hypothetical protein